MRQSRFFYRDPDAPKPNQPLNVGVVAIIEQDGAILLEERSDSARWSLIGGGLEMSESLEEGLVREVREETGLEVVGYSLFGTYSDPSRVIQYPDGNVMRILTLAYRVSVAPEREPQCSSESLRLAFVRREELARLDVVETHRHILADYLEGGQLYLR